MASDQLRAEATDASKLKDWPSAASRWQRVVDQDPVDLDAHVELARALRHIGSFDAADAAVKAAERVAPDNPRVVKQRDLLAQKLSKAKMKAPGNVYHGKTAAAYQAKREKSVRWIRENEAVRDLLTRLPEGLAVIDLPFGTGRFTPYYVARGLKITGVDISPDMLAASIELYGAALDKATLEVGDATRLGYADNSFDLVVSVRFLQNIIPYGAVRTALAEMARVTRSFGILEFEVRKPEAVDVGPPPDSEPIRGLLYQPQIETMLANAGFLVREVVKVYDNEASDYCMILCDVS